MQSEDCKHVSWIEIDLDAIGHNIRQLRNVIGEDVKLLAVVKDNAYGHGDIEVAKEVLANGADYLGVATVDEGIGLRSSGIKAPVLVLNHVTLSDIKMAVENDLILSVYSLHIAELINQQAQLLKKKAKIHIKVDTGMNRIGYLCNENSLNEISAMAAFPNLDLEGIFSHFATTNLNDDHYAEHQLQKFINFSEQLKDRGVSFAIRHMASSGLIFTLQEAYLDMVRPGIMIYGVHTAPQFRDRIDLRPALSLKTHISQVKEIPEGSGVSYGLRWHAPKPSMIATLPLGYGRGIRRSYYDGGQVLIHGKRAPIIGTVCMDHMLVDVSDIKDVKPDDVAVLIGSQGDETILVDEMATTLNSISYEVFSSISNRMPYVYIHSGLKK